MPCFLITLHAYGTWWPDRPQGFVRRHEGVLPPDPNLADKYREAAKHKPAAFDRRVQRLLIDVVLAAAEPQQLIIHMISNEPTHVHVLCSWRTTDSAKSRQRSIKWSLSHRLNATFGRRKWFAGGGSIKQVRDRKHFDHLVCEYLPDHRGLKWCEGIGYFL